MVYFLLVYCGVLFGAASQEVSLEFYSDTSLRNMRKCLLPLVSNGPARELDAYLTYVSDIAFLSNFELANKPLEKHRQSLLFKVYRDQFELYNPSGDGDENEYEEDAFFAAMNGVKGVHCVETVIELGLRYLKGRALSPVEIIAYRLMNDMISRISDTLSADKQRRFWVSLIAQASAHEDKVIMFDLYMASQKDLEGIPQRLKQYNKLLEYALKS